jgi:hypothetical protein
VVRVTAEVRAVYVVYCAECHEGDGPHDYESEAEEWAEEHDNEYHTDHYTDADAADDAREHDRESRMGY